MQYFWFKTSEASQEVGTIISNNYLDMGLMLVWCQEKKRDYLVLESEVVQIILENINPYFEWNGISTIKK